MGKPDEPDAERDATLDELLTPDERSYQPADEIPEPSAPPSAPAGLGVADSPVAPPPSPVTDGTRPDGSNGSHAGG